MLYDKQDRLVATQDTVMKEKGQWLYTKYDQFGRVAITGIGTGYQRSVEQATVDGFGSNNVTRISTPFFNRQGIDVYYNNPDGSYPNSSNWVTLLSLNYYDTYPGYYFNPSFPTNILGEPTLTETPTTEGLSTKSLPVMSLVKNIEDDNWTKNYTYYDKKGRAIGSYSINHLGGRTQVESRLDFAGVVKQSIIRHKRLDTDTDKVITENFTYDSQNRLLTHTHQVDNNPVEYLAQNSYNELSQLSGKKVGGISPSAPLQDISYSYNIRGWMTKINDPANLNGKLFGYEIKYNNPENAVPKFNGNITEVDWITGAVENDPKRRYFYEYDKLNRLTNAFYKEPSTGISGSFDEYLTYDLNGNISNLKRTAIPVSGLTGTLVDNLDYQYTGNRLDKIIENSTNETGYEGGNNLIDYDVNGNMITMKDKGIQTISYNYLNLPYTYAITQNNLGAIYNVTLNYLYRADGSKLRKTYVNVGPRGGTTTTNVTDYLDGFHYNFSEVTQCLWCRTEVAYEEQSYQQKDIVLPPGGGVKPPLTPSWILSFVPTAEGFYSFEENRYIYQYTDHLGNARISYAKNADGTLGITDKNDYYPFGLNHIGGSKGMLGGYHNYKYNGKELQETGMYDYGARFYMPDIGRWGTIDPLAETSRRWSTYTYAYNNPIRFIDPDGRQNEDWVKRTGQSNWEYHSNITSEDQAKAAGFTAYANGRGDANSSYTTSLAQNGVDTGVTKTITLGEGGNWSASEGGNIVDSGVAQDQYVNMKPVDDFGKFMAGFVAFPMLLEASPFLVSGGSAEVLAGKATLSTATQFLGTGDVNIMSVVGDTFGAYGSGEVFGGVSELSAKKLINGESAFRTVFNGSMSTQEATSNIGFALGSKGFGKLNGATKVGATGMNKAVVGANNFLIGTGMYGAAAANATEIQKKQK